MGDPGLKSKFVEMQQQDRFAVSPRREAVISDYELGHRLDVARLTEQLQRAVHPRHKRILRRALKDAIARLTGCRGTQP